MSKFNCPLYKIRKIVNELRADKRKNDVVAEHLNNLGYTTPRGKAWAKHSVSYFFPIYKSKALKTVVKNQSMGSTPAPKGSATLSLNKKALAKKVLSLEGLSTDDALDIVMGILS